MDNSINADVLLSRLRDMAAQAAAGSAANAPATNDVTAAGAEPFKTVMQQALQTVNNRQQSAAALAADFERGDDIEITRVMVEMQKARISFEALSQVRNKFVSAYQEIMRMSL